MFSAFAYQFFSSLLNFYYFLLLIQNPANNSPSFFLILKWESGYLPHTFLHLALAKAKFNSPVTPN